MENLIDHTRQFNRISLCLSIFLKILTTSICLSTWLNISLYLMLDGMSTCFCISLHLKRCSWLSISISSLQILQVNTLFHKDGEFFLTSSILVLSLDSSWTSLRENLLSVRYLSSDISLLIRSPDLECLAAFSFRYFSTFYQHSFSLSFLMYI